MNMATIMGRKFNGCHQLAVLLTRHMDRDEALAVCRENGWDGVTRALEEQGAIVTAQQPASTRRH